MIKVYWQTEEKRLVRLDYYDPIATWDEYMGAITEAYDMVLSQPHDVHMIHNPGSASMPKGNALQYLRRVINLQPANTGAVVMIVENMFARRITEIILRLSANVPNYLYAKSLDDAFKLLEEHLAEKAQNEKKQANDEANV